MQNSNLNKNEIIKGEIRCKIKNFVPFLSSNYALIIKIQPNLTMI